MSSNSYVPSYKTPYTGNNSKTQVKSFNNNNSINMNNYVSSFTKIGYPQSSPKQFNNNLLLYKVPTPN